MASQTDNLANNAKCIEACLPAGMYLPVLIYLWSQMAGKDPTNTNALIAGAVCIDSCIPKGLQLPVLISLIAGASGGTAAQGGPVLGGVGPPTTPPPIPSLYAIYNDFSQNGEQWWWNPTAQAWV
jgi:hypothetical protein